MMTLLRAVLFLVVLTGSLSAQQAGEQGKFILHKFAKAIGEESYTIERAEVTPLSDNLLLRPN